MDPSFVNFGFVLTILLSVLIKTHGYAILMDEQQCIYTRRDPEFQDFYPLSKIPNSQTDGYKAIVRVAVTSDYGYAHILLSESDNVMTKGYEFALSPWDDAEIRRRENIYGKYEVVAKSDYNVKEYAPNVTNLEVSISSDGVIKLLDLNSNATFSYKDPVPLEVKFISFSARSKLEFNCDYNVLTDYNQAKFIQTRCETIFGWREELFHPLTSVISSQPTGYQAKVDISILSDYGDIHILLSETMEREKDNPCYEFVIGDRFKTHSEIRRKNSINEAYDFVGQKVFDYNMKGRRSHLWMQISVSDDGIVSFMDLDEKLQFNYTDTKTSFPLNYITFGGYRKYPATYQINCMKAAMKC